MNPSSVNILKFDCLVLAGKIQLNSMPMERLTNVVPEQMLHRYGADCQQSRMVPLGRGKCLDNIWIIFQKYTIYG